MIVDIKINKHDYGIEIDGNNFTAISYGIVKDENSARFGEKTRKELGYFTKLPNAAERLLREEVSSDDSRVSLSEFITRYEALTEELKAQFDKIKL